MKPLALLLILLPVVAYSATSDEIVLLVTADGLRWQEVFGGAEGKLVGSKKEALRHEFLRDSPQERREILLPFTWRVVAKQGQIFGNQFNGGIAQLTNGKKFSYPGYQELLAGFADPRIDSNGKHPNPNVSVLEWLNRRPGFTGQVVAFGTWDVLPFILNRERSGLPILAGSEPIADNPLSERQAAINDLLRDTPVIWEGNPFDSFAFHAALEHLKRHRPRVLYLMFGETDEWAHSGDYGAYLHAAQREDRMVQILWETAQQIAPGNVSLLMTTDHGRGSGAKWKSHGQKIKGAEDIWIAAIGPRIPPLGERSGVPRVTLSQVAPTVAALAGEDYAADVPQSAEPLPLATKK